LNGAGNLVGRGVGEQGHDHAAQPLRGGHGGKQARAVFAQQPDMVPALQTLRRQTGGQGRDLIGQLAPSQGLPYAAAFLANGRAFGAGCCLVEETLRKGVHLVLIGGHALCLPPSGCNSRNLCGPKAQTPSGLRWHSVASLSVCLSVCRRTSELRRIPPTIPV